MVMHHALSTCQTTLKKHEREMHTFVSVLPATTGENEQYDREVNFIAAATEAGLEAVVRISTAAVLIHPDST